MHLSVSLSHPVGRKHVVQVDYGSLQAPLAHPALQAHLYVMRIRLGSKICTASDGRVAGSTYLIHPVQQEDSLEL